MKLLNSLFALTLIFSMDAQAEESLAAPKVKPGRYQLKKDISSAKGCAEVFDVRVEKSSEGDVTVALGSRQGVLWKIMKDQSMRQGACNYILSQNLSEDTGGQTFVSANIEKCDDGAFFMGSEKRTFNFNLKSIAVKLETQKGGEKSPWLVESSCHYQYK